MAEWQSMESAPRDGQEVIILRSETKCYPRVMAAQWYSASDEMGWWDARHYFLADGDLDGWQPLPSPPLEQEPRP